MTLLKKVMIFNLINNFLKKANLEVSANKNNSRHNKKKYMY